MFTGNCAGFLKATKDGVKPGIYTGDWNLGVANSTGQGAWAPPVPSPPPPPLPPLGECSSPVAGWSLAVEPTAKLAGKASSAAACALLCGRHCTGYTWHDHTCAGYANACYTTFDRHAWADGSRESAGHHSAICHHGQVPARSAALGNGVEKSRSTPESFSGYFCGGSLEAWQRSTKGQDSHSHTCTNSNGECSSEKWLQRAREMLWAGER
eukprot:SAG11_NODE_1125_length_5773_cov_1.928974_5_plen_211_part_00